MVVRKSALVSLATIVSCVLVFLSVKPILAEDTTTPSSTIKYVNSITDVRSDSAKVFVESNCEPCEAINILLTDDAFQNQTVNVDVVDITSISKDSLKDYANKCDFDNNAWVTPTVVYGDTCLVG